MKHKKITKIEKERFFRKDKRYPKRANVTISYDTGISEKTISVRFPEEKQVSETESDFRQNPNLWKLYLGNTTVVYYLDTDKGFVYDCDGNYCGRFEKHDLKNAFGQIGLFLKTVRKQKG